MPDSFDHCQALVRERDRDRFIAALFAPAAARRNLFALYAFAGEVAHIADAVKEPLAGEIRLQWWRDAIEGRSDDARANPVAYALLESVEVHALPRESLVSLVDAHAFDIGGEPMASVSALERYLDATEGVLTGLACRVLANGSIDTAQAAFIAGRANGLTAKLRSIARDVSNGRLFVPRELLGSTDDLAEGRSNAALESALAQLRNRARAHLDELRKMELPAAALPAFLHLALVPRYLAIMESRGYDPFRTPVAISRLRRQFAIWRAARTAKV